MGTRIVGDCNVERAEELKELLLESLNDQGGLALDLSGVTSIDLSFCQILHAAKASCAARNAPFTTTAPLPRRQAAFAVLCGLSELADGADAVSSPLEVQP